MASYYKNKAFLIWLKKATYTLGIAWAMDNHLLRVSKILKNRMGIGQKWKAAMGTTNRKLYNVDEGYR